jgi:hypothetical protein
LFDYSALRGRIKEVYGTEFRFADALDLSSTSLSAKLNNKTQWTQKEINAAVQLLMINYSEISKYFFTEKVQEAEQS